MRSIDYNTTTLPNSSDPELMQVGFTRISSEEIDRCIRQNLFLYCGQPRHLKASCLTQPSPRNTNAVSSHDQISSSSLCV